SLTSRSRWWLSRSRCGLHLVVEPGHVGGPEQEGSALAGELHGGGDLVGCDPSGECGAVDPETVTDLSAADQVGGCCVGHGSHYAHMHNLVSTTYAASASRLRQ